APMVTNILNMAPHSKLLREAFGGQPSEQIDDYRGLDEFIGTPRGELLRKIVDPWEYRERLTQPKLLIFGTNDRYWPLDACELYWNDLVGEKYLIYIPNNGHSLPDKARIVAGLNALNRRIVTGQPLPRLEWGHKTSDGQIEFGVTSDIRPSRVRVWSATAANRDFRESKWTATDAAIADAAFTYRQPLPTGGFAALFGEAIFQEGQPDEFSLSTNIGMIPSKSPAAPGGK